MLCVARLSTLRVRLSFQGLDFADCNTFRFLELQHIASGGTHAGRAPTSPEYLCGHAIVEWFSCSCLLDLFIRLSLIPCAAVICEDDMLSCPLLLPAPMSSFLLFFFFLVVPLVLLVNSPQ